MELNPPPGLPPHPPGTPAAPVVTPLLPVRRMAPGRNAPLPDLTAVRQVAIPDSLPPYDGEATPPDTGSASQDEHRAGPDDPDDGPGGPGVVGRLVPGPDSWPSQFAQALAETLAGSRPAGQLAPWTTEETRQRIRELGPLLATSQRPRVRRIMTSAPAKDVLEMTAVVGFGPRVRVLALRLERAEKARRRWQCTALESA